MLEGRVLARCPSCRNTFSTDLPGRQNCPVCGKPLVVPDPRPGGAAGPQNAPATDVAGHPSPAGTPWERRSELGLPTAWARTVGQALFEPSRLFAAVRIERTAAHVGFAVLTGTVFSICNQLLARALYSPARMRRMLATAAMPPGFDVETVIRFVHPRPAIFVALLVATPLVMLAGFYLNALVTHGFGLLIGQAKRGFGATLAACAYAYAPLVLLPVPACGSAIAIVWLAVLTGIGLKHLHEMGTTGAAASVLVPYLVLCCASCGLGLVLFGAMMRTMAQ
jgi:hypothetical protein